MTASFKRQEALFVCLEMPLDVECMQTVRGGVELRYDISFSILCGISSFAPESNTARDKNLEIDNLFSH